VDLRKIPAVSYVGIIVGCLMAFLVVNAVTKSHAASKYVPSEIQSLKLQNAQKDVILQSVQFQQAQNAYQTTLTTYTNLAMQIKHDNKWPDNVKFDISHMTFCDNIDSQGQCPAPGVITVSPPAAPQPAPVPQGNKK
jgi:hypothetical protein